MLQKLYHQKLFKNIFGLAWSFPVKNSPNGKSMNWMNSTLTSQVSYSYLYVWQNKAGILQSGLAI